MCWSAVACQVERLIEDLDDRGSLGTFNSGCLAEVAAEAEECWDAWVCRSLAQRPRRFDDHLSLRTRRARRREPVKTEETDQPYSDGALWGAPWVDIGIRVTSLAMWREREIVSRLPK